MPYDVPLLWGSGIPGSGSALTCTIASATPDLVTLSGGGVTANVMPGDDFSAMGYSGIVKDIVSNTQFRLALPFRVALAAGTAFTIRRGIGQTDYRSIGLKALEYLQALSALKAADVPITKPAGMASTQVQAAIEELLGNKLGLVGGTLTGNLTVSRSGGSTLHIGGTGSNTLDIGRTDTAANGHIDFHTSGQTSGFDVRIQGSGGSLSNGTGVLTITASQVSVTGTLLSAGTTGIQVEGRATTGTGVYGNVSGAGTAVLGRSATGVGGWFESTTTNGTVAFVNGLSTAFTGTMLRLDAAMPAGTGWDAFVVRSGVGGTLNNLAILRGDGRFASDGAYVGTGADYAEMFEWLDGNPKDQDRVGITVAIEDGKIRPATKDDGEAIIGAISANPTVLGDGGEMAWGGRFITDEFGRREQETVYAISWEEEVEVVPGQERVVDWVDVPVSDDPDAPVRRRQIVLQEATKPVMGKRPVSYMEDALPEGIVPPKGAKRVKIRRDRLNPAYDPEQEYVPRSERPEWDPVGLMGKLRIRKGQPVHPRWIKLRDVSDRVEEWLILR